MGRVAPKNDSPSQQDQAAPRLSKLAVGEKVRLILIELGPNKDGEEGGAWFEWRHNLEAPALVQDGNVIREREWVGTFRCLGDHAVLAEKKRDPDSCPACRYAEQSDAFAPRPYYAMNVIKYATKAGSWNLQVPYSVQVLVWRFTENVYSSIISKMEMYAEGDTPVDLRRHDLLITCKNADFQQYELDLAPTAAWLSKEYNKADAPVKLQELVATTYRENKFDDAKLADEIAFKAAPATLADKSAQLASLLGLVADSSGVSTPPPPTAPRMSPDELATAIGGAAPPAPADAPEVNLSDILGGLEPAPAEEVAVDAPAPEPAPAAAPADAPTYDADSLDALLSGE